MKKLFIIIALLGCNHAFAMPRALWCRSQAYPDLAICSGDGNFNPEAYLYIKIGKNPIEPMNHHNFLNTSIYSSKTSDGVLYVQRANDGKYYLIDSENVRSEFATCSSSAGFCDGPLQ